jgi:hypothetical protein
MQADDPQYQLRDALVDMVFLGYDEVELLQHVRHPPVSKALPGMPTGDFSDDVWRSLWKWGQAAAAAKRELIHSGGLSEVQPH